MKQMLQKVTTTLLLLPALLTCALAQFDVSGTVQSSKGEQLVGVTVAIKNTNVGTTTNFDGKYTIRIPGPSGTLVFTYVGYRSVERTVSSASTVDVIMEETTSELEEVVVSGLATTVKRSNSANAVSQINAKELTGITTQSTLDAALQGKFPGVQITTNSGAPGGGINVRMRGTSSINGSAQPLYIIDGVYVDNSVISAGLNTVSGAATGGNTAVFDQDNPSNRIADLDPGDFQSVEVLKGASAAAIYGSRAAGGVVIINTKRGTAVAGGPQISFSQSLGWQQILRPLGVRQWDADDIYAYYFNPNDSLNSLDRVQLETQLFNDAEASGNIHDYEDELYGNHGLISDTRVSVSNGTDRTGFYISGSHRREDGIVDNTGYTKTGLRLNIDHDVSRNLEVTMSSNYLKTSADRGFFNNDNSGNTMSVSLSSTVPWAQIEQSPDGSFPDNPYAPSNFLQTAALITNNESVDRFIIGSSIIAKIVNTEKNSLKLILQGGLDVYALRTTAIFPKELQFEKPGRGTNGASIQGNTPSFNNNESALLVHTYFAPKVTFRTQGGLTRESFKRNTIIVTATQLLGAQTNVNQASSVATYQFRSEQLDFGGFAMEEINWDDKIIATLGIRGDKSSVDADPNEIFFYPKASLALNITRLGGFESEMLNLLKLRIAYGQSSNFPNYGATFTNLGSVIIDGIAGSHVNTIRGNEAIGPERQKELEAGLDLGLWNDRLTFEGTYYRKNVEDLFVFVLVPLSSGYARRVSNAATLQNKGVELGLNVEVIKKDNGGWLSGISWWKNKSEITSMDVPAFILGSFGATLGTFYVDTGKSATQIVGIGPDSLRGEGDEYVKYGDSEPDFQMSFYNSFRYKGWELNFLIHWKKGGDNVNLTALLTDFGGTSHDYDDITLDPDGIVPNGPYRISQLGASAEVFVEDASYLRFREIGLYYTFNSKNMASMSNGIIKGVKVGISARNAINIFKYNSYDPEVSNFNNTSLSGSTAGLSGGVEVNPFPSSKQFYASISLNF